MNNIWTSNMPDLTFNIVGDPRIGRRSLANNFSEKELQTFFSDPNRDLYTSITKQVGFEQVNFKIVLESTAYINTSSKKYIERKANVYILAYDCTEYISFRNLESWMEVVNKNKSSNTFVLVGTHADKEGKAVDTQEAKQFAESLKIPFYEINTRDTKDVEEVFFNSALAIIEQQTLEKGVKPIKFNVNNKMAKDEKLALSDLLLEQQFPPPHRLHSRRAL